MKCECSTSDRLGRPGLVREACCSLSPTTRKQTPAALTAPSRRVTCLVSGRDARAALGDGGRVPSQLRVERLGVVPYAPMLALQQERHAEVVAGGDETLFLLEHTPV